MNALANALGALQERILRGDDAMSVRVRGADARHRLRIYTDAYRLRLVEILGNDFPATRDALGEDGFAACAERYLQAHPSTQPSVRHLGAAFADWLETQPDVPHGLHELARFEWRQAAAFDAADAPALAIDDVATLPADAWPTLRLRLHPSARLLDTERLAIRDGAPAIADNDVPSRWLFWRDADGDACWRSLEDDEAEALHAVAADALFGDLCERLSVRHGDEGALRAASLLKRWLADGLLAAANDPD
ncbi:MAG: DNA-binding domain-containing protein [Thermomonas sp.]